MHGEVLEWKGGVCAHITVLTLSRMIYKSLRTNAISTGTWAMKRQRREYANLYLEERGGGDWSCGTLFAPAFSLPLDSGG